MVSHGWDTTMLHDIGRPGRARRWLLRGPFAAAILVGIAGCAGTARVDTAPTAESVAAVEQESAMSVTWDADVRAIVENRCSPCHLPGGYMYGRAPLNSFEGVSRMSSRIRTLVFETRAMPFMRDMPDAERELVARWIDAGSPR